MTGWPSTRTGPPETAPEDSKATAPRTGAKAAVPGNGVEELMVSNAATTTARPPHPSSRAAQAGRRRRLGVTRARIPPAPSSQDRDGSEKNAQGWLAWVSHTHRKKDATVTAVSPVTAVVRDAPARV